MSKKLIKLICTSLLLCVLPFSLTYCKNSGSSDKITENDSASGTAASSDTPATQPSDDVTATTPTDDGESDSVANENASASVPELEYKYVAFTFDDGPHNEFTEKIIDKLAEYDARATFFVVGNRVNESSKDILKYAVERGSEIGMHSFTHQHMFNSCDDKIYAQEINYTKNRLSSYVGVNATLLRPPGGLMSAERVAESDYPIILWSVDSEDWKHKGTENDATIAGNVETIVDNVLSNVGEGDIILMHDIYENTYKAFCIIIDTLYEDGYRFVTVSELLGDSIKSGAKFFSYTLN